MGVEVGVGLWTMQSTAAHPAQPTASYRSLGDDAVLVEQLGFHSLWTAEHHFWYDGWCPALMEAQAVAAARTTTLRLGNAVLVLPLHDPDRLARSVRTLHRLSGGRVVLGVGQGHRDAEFDAFGLLREDRSRLFAQALRRLPEEVPVLVGGLAAAALRRAARRGHGLILPQTLAPDELGTAVGAYREAGGRGPVGVLRDVWVARHGARARERFLGPLERHYAEEIGSWWPLGGEWPGFRAPRALQRQLQRVRSAAVVGDPGEVRARLAEVVDLGAQILVLRLRFDFTPPEEVEGALRLLAERVLPAL
jgi:alkanesulfonate monooxygenase SsuD/methylene tetrahydromethanopterin reductase-like flavin-dependent oxidoreductase (luciferase family)